MRRRALEALLRAYTAVDSREEGFRQRMLVELRPPGDPFARDRFTPGHFTASAFVVPDNGDALLLIYHRKLQRWLQPGGHVDQTDADIVAAARRELREEAGLSETMLRLEMPGIFDLDIHDIPGRPIEPAHLHFDVRFVFMAASTDVTAGSDADDVRWCALDAVQDLETDASVMRAVGKLRSLGAT